MLAQSSREPCLQEAEEPTTPPETAPLQGPLPRGPRAPHTWGDRPPLPSVTPRGRGARRGHGRRSLLQQREQPPAQPARAQYEIAAYPNTRPPQLPDTGHLQNPPCTSVELHTSRRSRCRVLIPVRRRGAVLQWIPSGRLWRFGTAHGSPHRERTTFDTPDPSASPVGGLNSERKCNTLVAAVDLGHTDPPRRTRLPGVISPGVGHLNCALSDRNGWVRTAHRQCAHSPALSVSPMPISGNRSDARETRVRGGQINSSNPRLPVNGQLQTVSTTEPLTVTEERPRIKLSRHGAFEAKTSGEHSQREPVRARGVLRQRQSAVRLDDDRLGLRERAQSRGQWPRLTPAGEVRGGHSACGSGSGAACSGADAVHPTTPPAALRSNLPDRGRMPRPLTSTSTEKPVMRP